MIVNFKPGSNKLCADSRNRGPSRRRVRCCRSSDPVLYFILGEKRSDAAILVEEITEAVPPAKEIPDAVLPIEAVLPVEERSD